jgi:integrase
MGRPSGRKIFKKSISIEDYLRLVAIIEEKRVEISNSKRKTVKLELNKLNNIKGTITILVHTGLRIGEVLSITNGNIREAILNKNFSAYESKTKRPRNVNISKVATVHFREVFAIHINEVENDNFVIRKLNKPKSQLSQNYFQNMINDFLHEALGERYSSHGFRRQVIIDLINYDTVKTAQMIIGHKDERTTRIYEGIVSDSAAQTALEARWKNKGLD